MDTDWLVELCDVIRGQGQTDNDIQLNKVDDVTGIIQRNNSVHIMERLLNKLCSITIFARLTQCYQNVHYQGVFYKLFFSK